MLSTSTMQRSGAVAGQQRRGVGAASVAPAQRPRVTLARAVETQTRPSLTKPQATASSSVDFQDAPVGQAPSRPAGAPTAAGGHKGATGPFAPAVQAVRAVVGEKEFNKIRGQAISLHSQVIKTFGSQFGVNTKQVQGLIRTAKKNGEWLGFLA